MKLLVDIPGDLLIDLLHSWLRSVEYCLLDSSCCNHRYREYFLQQLKFIPITRFEGSPNFYNWIYERELILKCLSLKNDYFQGDELIFKVNADHVDHVSVEFGNIEFSLAVSKVVNSCKSMKFLKWSNINEAHFEVLKTITNLHCLRQLQLEYTLDLETALTVISEHCHSLEHLIVHGNDYNSYFELYKRIFMNNRNLKNIVTNSKLTCSLIESCCPQIENVTIFCAPIDCAGIISLINNCPISYFSTHHGRMQILYQNQSKKSLEIDIVGLPSDDLIVLLLGIQELSKFVCNSYGHLPDIIIFDSYKTLEEIRVDHMSILNSTLVSLMQLCSSLKFLQFYSIGVSDSAEEFVSIFSTWKPQSLVSLVIKNAWIQYVDVIEIIQSSRSLTLCEIGGIKIPEQLMVRDVINSLNSLKNSGRNIKCVVNFYRNFSPSSLVFDNGFYSTVGTNDEYALDSQKLSD